MVLARSKDRRQALPTERGSTKTAMSKHVVARPGVSFAGSIYHISVTLSVSQRRGFSRTL
jgi:hypothetical protein